MRKHGYGCCVCRIVLISLLVNFFVIGLADAQVANWPQFRGPNCSGVAKEGESPPVEFGPAQNVFWKTPVPVGHSSPCIWGDRIFLSGFDEEQKEIIVFCINRIDGTLEWRQIVPADTITKVNSSNSPASPTLATDGDRVYAYFGSFGLICYDLGGKHQWSLPIPIPKSRHGMATSPVVVGEFVILNNDDLNGSFIMAVDRRSGEIAWKKTQPKLSKMPQECYATPVVWRNQIIFYRRGEIVAFDPENGEREWWFNSLTQGISTPVVANDMLFVATYSTLGEPELHIEFPDFNIMIKENDQNADRLVSKEEFPEDLTIIYRPEAKEGDGRTMLKRWFNSFDANKDTFLDSTEWEETVEVFTEFMTIGGLVAIKPGGKGDITATNLLWREIKAVPEVPSPLYYDGLVYMIKNGGIASCMNASTGELLYRQRLGSSGTYFSSPIAASGKIYIASRGGTITVFEGGQQLNILAKNEIDEDIYATPAVIDNTLYVRTTEHLYAFCEL